MPARVICISRALHAGAEEAAAQVARELGFRCIDEEIVARAAARENLAPAQVADEERRKSFFQRLIEDIARGAAYGGHHGVGLAYPVDAMPQGEDLRRAIREAIEEFAAQGDVVIVAHAASHALGARDGVLRVLVSGSPQVRAGRLAAAAAQAPADALQAIIDSDAARLEYLQRFYQVKGESPAHYDLMLSTDRMTPAQAAQLIVAAARL